MYGGNVLRVPKFYDRRYESVDEVGMRRLRRERRKKVKELDCERLRVKEKCKELKLRRKERRYESFSV